jgi:hypothetical protein
MNVTNKAVVFDYVVVVNLILDSPCVCHFNNSKTHFFVSGTG